MTTLRVQVAEMAQIVLSEGAAHNRDLAASALLRAGFTPRFIAAFLDDALEAARDMARPNPANVFHMPRRIQ